MRGRGEELVSSLLRRLTAAVSTYPRLFFYPQVALFLLCVGYTVQNLQFDTSRDNLVGGDKKYHQNFLRFKQEFPLQDDLVVVIESEDREKNRQFVERLGARLEAETNHFVDVVYKGDLKMLGPKALLFVPEAELQELLETLRDYRPFLEQFTHATNLTSLFNLVNRQFLGARRDESGESEGVVKALPALTRILEQASASLQRRGTPPSPGLNALFGGGEEAESKMYITYADARIYLVTARPASADLKADAVVRLRSLVAQTQLEVSGVNVGVTGEPILELDEMAQSQQDTMIATAISLGLVALIFVYGYHETGRPIKATIALIIGLGYTMGFTTLVVGHLNILTITFAPILIGLAIDFGVHLISRYEEELRQGGSEREALEKAMVYTGLGIFTGALTTAGAFLAMGVTNFRGIQEMGIICGGGLVICLVPMMTFLPVLLLRGRQNVLDHRYAIMVDRRARIEQVWLTRPKRVTFITVACCLAAVFPARTVYFDYNLLNMQSEGLPAVIFEKKLINSAKKSVLFGAILANSLEEAVALEARLTNLPSVASVDFAGIDEMSRYLTEDQTRKLALVPQIRAEAQMIEIRDVDTRPVDLNDLSQTLWSLFGYVTLALPEVKARAPELYPDMIALQKAISAFRLEMLRHEPVRAAEKLAVFQQALFRDVQETFQALRTQDARTRLTIGDLPDAIRNRFIGVTGKFLVQVYPKRDVWQRENQEEFVQQLRRVDRNVTGTPVQLYEYTSLLKSSYQEAAGYSLAAIALLVFLHFRSLISVVLALLPVGAGTLWMIGLMGLADVPFNPANIMTLPLIIGVGVTNGIHILNRFAEEQNPGILAKSTGKAVLVSGLTTIAGFGSLVFGKHQGIQSLGYMMAVGTTTCMLAGLTFLPAVITLLTRWGWRIKAMKRPSGDNAQSPTGSGGTEVKTSSMS